MWLAGAVLGAGMACADVVRITDLSHGTHDGRLRLTFEMTEATGFSSFHLADPDRLVIDLPLVEWAVPVRDREIPYVAEMRHGLYRPDDVRIVLDLTQPLRVERIYTEPARAGVEARLIIDLAPVSRAEFDAIAGWPEGAQWTSEAGPAPPERGGDFIVAIDPGHGGVDPGARFGGLIEKRVVLAFSRRLARAVNALPGFRAYLIRTDDSFVPLAERVARAHRAGAGVIISVHADVLEEGAAAGMSVYTLSESATDRAAVALAERENRSDVLAGADLGGESDSLARLLIELAQRDTTPKSELLAQALLGAVRGHTKLLRTRPHRHANFRVLKAPDIPSVLLELGFMNAEADRKRLRSDDWQDRIAARVALGIAAWHRGVTQ